MKVISADEMRTLWSDVTMPAEPTEAQGAGPAPLHRSRTDRVLAGVCGGIAETYGADPTAVRLLAAIIGIFTGIFPMLVVYLVAAVVIPESSDGEAPVVPVARSRMATGQAAVIIGISLIVVGVAALVNELFRIEWDRVWPAVLIAVGGLIVLLVMRQDDD